VALLGRTGWMSGLVSNRTIVKLPLKEGNRVLFFRELVHLLVVTGLVHGPFRRSHLQVLSGVSSSNSWSFPCLAPKSGLIRWLFRILIRLLKGEAMCLYLRM